GTFNFWRWIETIFINFKKICCFKKSLDQHTAHTIHFTAFSCHYALSNFFLKHTNNTFHVRSPVKSLEQNLSGNVVRKITNYSKGIVKWLFHFEEASVNDFIFYCRVIVF